MLIFIIFIGLILMILERTFPDQDLPSSHHWWLRVFIVNLLQLGIVILGMHTWDIWLNSVAILRFKTLPPAINGAIAYLFITFCYYWWHRWRHEIPFLWRTLHQLHHSPARIETITSFYKHPLEILSNALIISSINFLILGIDTEAASYALLYSSLGEYLYHMNISTPHIMGYFFQRPEMHRIHHQRNHHRQNYSDIPIWDILFGTHHNPKKANVECGFDENLETQLQSMLCFKDVHISPNNPSNITIPSSKKTP
jgi:sterol desaturase/sphingolipid hydroxylase (fatty acid hydroxylase superfamily)